MSADDECRCADECTGIDLGSPNARSVIEERTSCSDSLWG